MLLFFFKNERQLLLFMHHLQSTRLQVLQQRLHFCCVSCWVKSSLCQEPFNFLLCMRGICHVIRKKNLLSGLLSNGASFAGIKKIVTTLICYARLMQDSRNALNRSRTGKKLRFLKFIRPHFWTDLNGCRQRLLFAWQLTQQNCNQSTFRVLAVIFLAQKQ